MAADMEAPMFIIFNIHVGLFIHVCMVHPSTYPYPPPTSSTHLPILKGGPPESVKIQ